MVTFDRVQSEGREAPSLQDAHVGSVEQAGSMELSEGAFTVRGSGADIWDKADGFHYVYRECAGDGEIVARVLTQENTHAWAKAGVMVRESLDVDSPHVSVFVTPEKGADMQYRTSRGGRGRSRQVEAGGLGERAQASIKRVRAWEGHKPDNPAIPFSAVTLSGERIELAQSKGSVVLLDFWATWCGPCMPEVPVIKSLHDSFSDKGLVVLSITKERDIVKLKRFLEEREITWRQIVDSEQEESVVELYQVRGIPCTFLIDREGIVRERGLRGEELEFAVKKLLGRAALKP